MSPAPDTTIASPDSAILENKTFAAPTRYRWVVCSLLFFATTINYLDRQVLSLTWKDFLVPEFHWTDKNYGTITALFSIFYAVSMLFAGRFVDWLGTRRGFLWAIGVWSIGACLHALCGVATAGMLGGEWLSSFGVAKDYLLGIKNTALVVSTSVSLFVLARLVLAVGEAGNFPAAIKATAEYFPKKDRALATSIFNAGATVGAMAAPLSIPFIARAWGWEMTFIIIGSMGFLWMAFWSRLYGSPEKHTKVNGAELAYIQQDSTAGDAGEEKPARLTWRAVFGYRQTWAFAFGKFMTDGVWWFFLFWMPAYLKDIYGMDGTKAAWPLTLLYAITLLSILGGWLPRYLVDKKGFKPFEGRRRAMLIFAFVPLLALLAQPLGTYSYWWPVIIIGIAGAAHQAWSANIFSTVSDMFPKTAVATVTGIGGMAGGIGAFLINKGSGQLFDFAGRTRMQFAGFEGKEAGYFIVFSICAVAYLIGWVVMRALVPRYSPIVVH